MEKAILERALELCNTRSKRFQTWFQAFWLAFNRYDRFPQRVTDLLVGAVFGLEEIVKVLLEKGVGVDSKDSEYSRTPLSWAAGNGHEAVVKLLLEKGADVNSEDNDGRTPLSWAANNNYEAITQLLLEKVVVVDFNTVDC